MRHEKQPLNARMGGFLRHALTATAVALAAATAQTAVAADNQAIVNAAKEEAKQGKFLIMVSSPKGERAQRALVEAFQKRFDLKLDWEWIPLNSAVSAPRIIEQAKANVRLPSAIGGYPAPLYDQTIVKNGLDMEVDWVGEFGQMFPTIGAASVDGVLPRHQKRLMAQWNVLYVMVYNTRQVKENEVPTTFEELTQPKWRGRFAMANNSPTPLEYQILEMGEDKVADLTRRLVANQPRFKQGQPAVVGAIVAGEAAVGVGGYTALAEAQKARGAPVDWKVMPSLPIQPLYSFMLKGAPQPNLGKLFLAWLSTEGLELQEKEEALSLYRNEKSPTTQRIRQMNPNVKLLEFRTDDDYTKIQKAYQTVMDVVSGAATGK